MPRNSTVAGPGGPLAALSDAALLEGVRQASEPHFNELYRRYFQRIYNYCYARVRNRADTEEIVQETFTAVFRSIGAFRGESALLTWIFGIARNTLNNHLRRVRAEGDRLGVLEADDVHPAHSLSVATPEEQLALRRYIKVIQERLSGVAAWQLDVFRLRHEQNLPIREIARRTSRSDDAIRSSLYRVKRMLLEAVDAQRTIAPVGGRSWGAA